MGNLTNFVHDDKPKVVLSALSIVWHWDAENDIPNPGSKLYVIVEINYGNAYKEYRLYKNAELFIDEENEEDEGIYTTHAIWITEDDGNLLSVDEENTVNQHITKQIFAWAYMPDDAEIFPMSAMNTILQKKRYDNV